MATFSNWDFFNKYVQSGLIENRYLHARHTLIASGPPRLAMMGVENVDQVTSGETTFGNTVYPIGTVQNLGVGQTSQWLRIWEIGSERSYFMRGRTVGQLAFGKIMYHGPSLLRQLYAFKKSDAYNALYSAAEAQNKYLSGDKDMLLPGYNNWWINLASDAFETPVGLLVYMQDNAQATYGGMFFECCVVPTHNFGWDGGSLIIQEQSTILYERIVSLPLNAIQLITDAESAKSAYELDEEPVGSGA